MASVSSGTRRTRLATVAALLSLLKHAYCLGACVTGSIFLQGEVRLALAPLTEDISVQVEVDMFSGRVNLAWRLSPDESQEFLHLF